jgi:D-alanine-D-alanine ligase
MEVARDLVSIETLPSRRPLVVFNLIDAVEGDGRLAPRVPARLDALGIAYTGCSTSALLKTLSKFGTKLKLAHAGLPTPDWSADGTGFHRDARVIAKVVWEHAHLAWTKRLWCVAQMRRGSSPHALCALTPSIFAETYIEGREFHLALLERIWGWRCCRSLRFCSGA